MQKTTLNNGMRVVTEHVPGAQTSSLGVWVGVGNRDESARQAGASHFLEHLLFKGTSTRSGREIAELVDATGGDMNAFTSKEYTAFYLRMPAWHMDLGMELLGDVVVNPAFTEDDVEAERQVILEELAIQVDEPEDLVHSALYEALFPDHPLGWEVLGSVDSVSSLDAAQLHAFHERWYLAANLVFCAAGAVDHESVVAKVEERFGALGSGLGPARRGLTNEPQPGALLVRPTEQANVAFGWRSLAHGDPGRHALALGNQIIGGGLSSRLFQSVREDRGLAYSVYSTMGGFSDTGVFTIYAGTVPSRAAELIGVVRDEIADVVDNGVTEREVEVARQGVEGSLVLGLEDSGSKMHRLGTGETILGRVAPIEEYLEAVRRVTLEDVNTAIRTVLGKPETLATVGPTT